VFKAVLPDPTLNFSSVLLTLQGYLAAMLVVLLTDGVVCNQMVFT